MIKLGMYYCRWKGCDHKCESSDEMDVHVIEEHLDR